jgi:hypothetical protein
MKIPKPRAVARFSFNSYLDEADHKRRLRLMRRLGCRSADLLRRALAALEEKVEGERAK